MSQGGCQDSQKLYRLIICAIAKNISQVFKIHSSPGLPVGIWLHKFEFLKGFNRSDQTLAFKFCKRNYRKIYGEKDLWGKDRARKIYGEKAGQELGHYFRISSPWDLSNGPSSTISLPQALLEVHSCWLQEACESIHDCCYF